MTEDTPRRLYRSREDRVIGGVAAGIGNHLGVDPVLIRISFVALAIAGIGVLLYLIGWIAIPEAPAGQEPTPARSSAEAATAARILIGTVLVVIGVLLLLDLYFSVRRFIWPASVIMIGLAVIAYGARR